MVSKVPVEGTAGILRLESKGFLQNEFADELWQDSRQKFVKREASVQTALFLSYLFLGEVPIRTRIICLAFSCEEICKDPS